MDGKASQQNTTHWPSFNNTDSDTSKDHFIQQEGIHYAGTHLLIDFWGARKLDDIAALEDALRASTSAAKATLLHIHLHHFSEGGGISGVAVLAESHISVHTWPERQYAAFDVFMCGDAQPESVLPILEATFSPKRTSVVKHLRGRVDTQSIE